VESLLHLVGGFDQYADGLTEGHALGLAGAHVAAAPGRQRFAPRRGILNASVPPRRETECQNETGCCTFGSTLVSERQCLGGEQS
jgi:hypothetical protein